MKQKARTIFIFLLLISIIINGCDIHTKAKPQNIILCENVNSNCETLRQMENKCYKNCEPYDIKIFPTNDKKILCECIK